MTQKKKVWRKKKYGFGYVTVSTVTYTCKEGMKPINSDVGNVSNEPNLSPVLANDQGGSVMSKNSEISDGIPDKMGALD